MSTALSCTRPVNGIPAWHVSFLGMLSAIRRSARFCFRKLRPEVRDELIEDMVANSLAAFVRLVERGKTNLAYASALARFGVAQAKQGRQLGSRLNIRDVSSRYAQQMKGFRLQRLDEFDESSEEWKEVLIEDRRATPADVAASRINFAAWLGTMSTLRRKIAQCLATGESTFAAAQRFAVSPGRISQLRREFQSS